MQKFSWWRGAVIYQIYPRSFMDSNSDGVGDLPGIISKLDYIASLGVDAIWVSPFFRSPMKDFGYDISDYRDVDPLFGNLSHIDQLIAGAHQRGIKLMIDQVLSHTSDQHDWFMQSRQSRDNPKADWYVWADPREDGTPPNNWLAIFGGSAWEWEPRRQQYYLHNFLKSQPDLNFHNPDVQDQILQEVEFWLARGVDGLRLDAINFCFHDQALRSNPAKPVHERKGRGFSEDNPYAYQRHIYDNTRPENLEFIKRLRQLMDTYPDTVTLGEISSEDSLASMAEYTAGVDRLHMAYSFELLSEEFTADYIRNTVQTLEAGIGEGWPCWSIGNHDVSRVLSRWGRDQATDNLAKLLNALLLSLRGSVCCYQGEELGLTEASLSLEQLQDPYGIAFWPQFKGRDGCRTPMPWTEEPYGGFSDVDTWLPVPDQHKTAAVSKQELQSDSVLQAYRQFIAWRKEQPALRYGTIEFVELGENILAFERVHESERLLVIFNLSAEAVTLVLPSVLTLKPLAGHGFTGKRVAGDIYLQPWDAFFAHIN